VQDAGGSALLSCEKVEKSNKLLQFRLSFGKDGERTILSGIAKYYKPEELVGKQVVAVVNLAPRKIAGIESQGMIRTVSMTRIICA